MANESRYDRVEFVEIALPNAPNPVTQKVSFPDIDNLRNVYVNAIVVHRITDLSVCPSGNPTINLVAWRKATLTLTIDGEESISNVPLTNWNPPENDGRIFVFSVPKIISWQKCFFLFPNLAGVVVSESFAVSVFYEKKRS